MTDEELIGWLWHDAIEDKLGFTHGVGVIKMNLSIEITPKEAEERFLNYFENLTGVRPYSECPYCKNKLLPRRSKYGYFIGCSKYPTCKFVAYQKK